MKLQGFREIAKLAGTLILMLSWCLSQSNAADLSVVIDGSQEHQVIEGFGGNEAWLFPPASEYSRIFDNLGVSILRFRMLRYTEAAPDQSGNQAAENDNNDPSIIDWSGVNTKWFHAIAALLKKAQDRGVKLAGTIWSPPGWMKTTNSAEAGGSLKLGYEEELVEFILIWVKGMQKYHGVHINYVSVQNEPNFETQWPICGYTQTQLRDVIKLLGERFRTEGITTKIYAPDVSNLRSFNSSWADIICQDPVVRSYVDRLATHSYNEDFWNPDSVIDKWMSAHKLATSYGKPLWLTEYCNDGRNPGTWTEAILLAQHIHNALVYGGVSAWLTYDLYRDPSKRPIAVFDDSGKPTPKFYALRQYFRYVRPGALKIKAESSDNDIMVTSFIHKQNNTFTIIVINRHESDKTVSFAVNNVQGVSKLNAIRTSANEDSVYVGQIPVVNGSFTYTFPTESITTLVSN